MSRRLELAGVLLVCGLLVAILGSEAALYRPPPLRATTTNANVASSQWTGSGLDVKVRVQLGGAVNHVRIAALPLTGITAGRSVAVFDDPAYPVSATDPRTVRGVYDTLAGELRVLGFAGDVSSVDAPTMQALLTNTNRASERILVVTTGALPATVYSNGVDLLTPWLQAGGILFWGADAIGYYGARPGRPLDPKDGAVNRREAGVAALLGAGAVDLPATFNRTASQSTPVADALELQYDRTAFGIRLNADQASQFRPLGWRDATYSSITAIPKGQGFIVDFGGEVFDEGPVAHDIAVIILSEVLASSGTITYGDANPDSLAADGTVALHVDTGSATQVELVAYDYDEGGVYFQRLVLSNPSGS